jgi:ATP-dependent DNA ligase
MLCETIPNLDINTEKYHLQIKYDGCRVIWNGSQLIMRSGINRTLRFKHIAEELMNFDNCILDGELVVFDEKGKSDFNLIQKSENYNKAVFVVFDILRYKGIDIIDKPIEYRYNCLSEIFKQLKTNVIKQAELMPFDLAYINKLEAENQEGVILKRKGTKYINRRSTLWLKYKFYKEQVVKVLGHEEGATHGTLITNLGKCSLPSMDLYHDYKKNHYDLAKVKYIELTEKGVMRFPIFMGFVGDKNG